jgi:hypothetical protein
LIAINNGCLFGRPLLYRIDFILPEDREAKESIHRQKRFLQKLDDLSNLIVLWIQDNNPLDEVFLLSYRNAGCF